MRYDFRFILLIVVLFTIAVIACSSMPESNHPLIKTNAKGIYVLPNTCTEPFLECCYPHQFDSLPEVGKNGVIGIWTEADIDTFLKYKKKGEIMSGKARHAYIISMKKDTFFLKSYFGDESYPSDKHASIGSFYLKPAYVELRKGVFRLNESKRVEVYYREKSKKYEYHQVSDGVLDMYDPDRLYYEIDTINKTISHYYGKNIEINKYYAYYTFSDRGKYYKKLADLYHKLSYYVEECKAADTATIGRWSGSMGGYFRLFYKNKKYYMLETFDMDDGDGQYYQVDVTPHPKGLKVQMHLHDTMMYHNPLYAAYKLDYDVIEFDNNNRLVGYFEDKRVYEGYHFLKCYNYSAKYDAMYYKGIDTLPNRIKFEEPFELPIEAMRNRYKNKK